MKRRKRYRRHFRRTRRSESLRNLLLAVTQKKTDLRKVKLVSHYFTLSPQRDERVTYVYKVNVEDDSDVVEITCVSYDLLLENEWITVVYYDSHHGGILHRHEDHNLVKNTEIVSSERIKKKGTQKQLLTWVIHDLTHSYLSYKNRFLRINKKYLQRKSITV
ncbi:hypothetical protein A3A79_04500 [Candidatus Gottesmanbacteria bacterium RIFCSPLOWO2_01_FULL_43_11b]|nr:MAG: hypothetical protein A3A79_04500 [Candidatus Gottesmanbacteria bacterium RIFCSPLOWO2_01_FULL_43_11b]